MGHLISAEVLNPCGLGGRDQVLLFDKCIWFFLCLIWLSFDGLAGLSVLPLLETTGWDAWSALGGPFGLLGCWL